MSDDEKAARGTQTAIVPVAGTRTLPESEYVKLQARAGEADRLEDRVAELERALVTSETRLLVRQDPVDELVSALLPALDDFERALAAAREAADVDAIALGVEMVRHEMRRVLGLHGVERIPVEPGQLFDPSLHQTLDGHDLSLPPETRLAAEVRGGYQRGKKVLRRAIVTVDPEPGAAQ